MATLSDPISAQRSLSDLTPDFPVREEMPIMHVRKRNGALEPVDVNKIVRAVQRSCFGMAHVDAIRVASKTIGGLYDGATTRALDTISIDTAASLIAENLSIRDSLQGCCWEPSSRRLPATIFIRFRRQSLMEVRREWSILRPPSLCRHTPAS